MAISTLVQEDGSNVADSNTYATLAQANQYFEDSRPSTVWTAATDDEKNAALLQARRLLDQMVDWVGARLYLGNQELEWPRQYVKHSSGHFFLDPNSVPDFLIWAQSEMAKTILTTDITTESEEVGIKKVQLDVFEIEYDGKTINKTIPKIVKQIIAGYGVINYGGGSKRIQLA